jgi:hypothetical protein
MVWFAPDTDTGRLTRGAGKPFAILALFVFLASAAALATPEAQYKKHAAQAKAIDVVSGPQLNQALRADPGRPLQLSGIIQGVAVTGEKRTVMLTLVDQTTVVIEGAGEQPELQTGSRVRCLVKAAGPSVSSRLDLVDVTWDKTPVEVLTEAARAALKLPVRDKREIALAAEGVRRAEAVQKPTTTRGGNQGTVIKRAIAYLNPRLTATEINTISESILAYSERYGVDPYLVVAVVAAESRFNPNARSYKGAAGLGQLMPATAAAHGVDPYDPVANLEVAIRIISRNLQKYNNDPLQALAAYNAGTGAVQRYGGVPPYRETRNYLWKIYEYYCWLRGDKPVARPK